MNKTVLFVEDGSVDVEELEKMDLGVDNIIIYRQGSKRPEFVDLEAPDTHVVVPVKEDEAEPKGPKECFTADEIKYAVEKAFADKGSEWLDVVSNTYHKRYRLDDDNIQSFTDYIIEILLKSGVGPIENGSY